MSAANFGGIFFVHLNGKGQITLCTLCKMQKRTRIFEKYIDNIVISGYYVYIN